jgi:hypothetical protein
MTKEGFLSLRTRVKRSLRRQVRARQTARLLELGLIPFGMCGLMPTGRMVARL